MKVSVRRAAAFISVCLLNVLFLAACAAPDSETQTLDLIKAWVYGSYNNIAQAEADVKADLPAEDMHRPMFQLFAPVEVPGIEGYIVYQQSSFDGSENPGMIFRHGLIQYLSEDASPVVRQRELYFTDGEQYKNAHRNPEILRDVTLDDMTWDEGCDFYLTADEDGDMVSGDIIPGACVMFNEGLRKYMYADDRVEITDDEYRFRGRYVDAEGEVLWGTESDELNTLVRQE